MKQTIPRLLDHVYLACIWVSGLAIALMSLVIPWGVYARYVLGTGSSWPEPVAVLLMVIFTFFGAAAGYRAGAHIAVQLLTDRLGEGARRVLRGAVHLLMFVVAVFAVVYGTRLCIATWGQVIGQLP